MQLQVSDKEEILSICQQLIGHARIQGHQITTDLLKLLRNYSSKGTEYQTLIGSNTEILVKTKDIIGNSLDSQEPSETSDHAICTGIQFLGNLVVNHPSNAFAVWNLIKGPLLLSSLKLGNQNVRNFISMVLLNVLLQSNVAVSELLSDPESFIIIELLAHSANIGAEFSLFVLADCILKQPALCDVYPKCNLESKIFLLETAHHELTASSKDRAPQCSISVEFVTHLKELFKTKCDLLLQTFRDSSSLEPLEYSRILEILGFCSGSDAYRSSLQCDRSLLISSVFLLIGFHQCGKDNETGFAALEDISILMPKKVDQLQEDPAFCFKRDLVRLVANLCWRNKENQDEVREMEVIPIILECCCLDARNPFMSQWCIIAVRNLCENNPENQKFIAALTEQGVVKSEVLEQMGFCIEEKRIRVR